MRRAVLLFNPNSGSTNGNSRRAVLEEVTRTLRRQGVDASMLPTTAPGSAGPQAAQAARDGAEIVFACGGDGTIHDALQGLVQQAGSEDRTAALGIIPLGTANALARHLRLPLDPAQAADLQTRFLARRLPVGKAEWTSPAGGNTRFFVVMAGAGPNGSLVYSLLDTHKQRLGRSAYYLHAARLFARTRFPAFQVAFQPAGTGHFVEQRAVSAMAVRVSALGGLFNPLTSGGSPESPTLRLILAHPPAALSLPLWFALSWAGLRRFNPLITTVEVSAFRCLPLDGATLHIQADGEWLGNAPLYVSIAGETLPILMPPD